MSFKIRELIKDKRVVLASASPRRKELMHLITDDFEIIPSDCDESVDGIADVFEIAEILAERKCREVAKRCNPDENTVIIGCDTLVVSPDFVPMGKPESREAALEMLKRLQGADSYVVSGVSVCFRGEIHSFSEKTEVSFYPASDDELKAYVSTGEPEDKAGAYAIQGLGGLFIRQIRGDYNNVVGLPVARLAHELTEILGGGNGIR